MGKKVKNDGVENVPNDAPPPLENATDASPPPSEPAPAPSEPAPAPSEPAPAPAEPSSGEEKPADAGSPPAKKRGRPALPRDEHGNVIRAPKPDAAGAKPDEGEAKPSDASDAPAKKRGRPPRAALSAELAKDASRAAAAVTDRARIVAGARAIEPMLAPMLALLAARGGEALGTDAFGLSVTALVTTETGVETRENVPAHAAFARASAELAAYFLPPIPDAPYAPAAVTLAIVAGAVSMRLLSAPSAPDTSE